MGESELAVLALEEISLGKESTMSSAVGAPMALSVADMSFMSEIDTFDEAKEVLAFDGCSDASLPDDKVPAVEARKLAVVGGGKLALGS
ncbi:hypothetical protein F441_09757 [Phytophthora nicotianae CJ01A1]|uniref:Uncharacterized protein n=1 Tax=Phytophthora nicotianae CJ01A1 TaxID=1317063 RepID=W2WZ78_PHYNI|nr:hypothetical protein F441_09757 [Phytophthora nicotianae CJ01A1]